VKRFWPVAAKIKDSRKKQVDEREEYKRRITTRVS